MIRPIDIRLNAAHPELPLLEAVTFTGSPSTVLIRGVPPNCGRWAITAVFVAASFPDGSTTTRAAVQSADGVWVATLPATATSGRTANGIRIMADGIDENGEAVTGYILGVADFAVASLDVTPAPEPGETSYQMLYFDAAPSVLHKGDVTKIDGDLKFYNGSAWEPFAAPVTLDDAVTRASANGVKSSGIWSAIWGALSALPTGFSSLYDWCVDQLAGKLSTSGGTMTGGIAFGTEDDYGYMGLAYDDETHRLRIIDVWNENNAYLEVPNTADGSRVAFMSDVNNAIAAIPYDRITITTGQLQDHAEQKVTLNAATTTLSLPALTDLTGKVSDFGIDVVNGYEVSGTPTAASFSLAGTIGTDYNLIVPEGDDWSEMSALAAGEMAVYYFTLSAFQINDKPTWEVMKKVVTLVPVPSAP